MDIYTERALIIQGALVLAGLILGGPFLYAIWRENQRIKRARKEQK